MYLELISVRNNQKNLYKMRLVFIFLIIHYVIIFFLSFAFYLKKIVFLFCQRYNTFELIKRVSYKISWQNAIRIILIVEVVTYFWRVYDCNVEIKIAWLLI